MQYQDATCRLSANNVVQRYIQCMQARGYRVVVYGSGTGAQSAAAQFPGRPGPAAVPVSESDRGRDDWHAAYAALDTRDWTEAMRLLRKIEAECQNPSTCPDSDPSDGLATTRWRIGSLYEHGNGVPQNYEEAAAWYQKAIEPRTPRRNQLYIPGKLAARALGIQYFYGLGVPRDKAKARQLWEEGSDDPQVGSDKLLRLLDNSALPKTMNPDHFSQDVGLAITGLDEKEAQEREIAEQQREKEHTRELEKYNRGDTDIKTLACTESGGARYHAKIVIDLSSRVIVSQQSGVIQHGTNMPIQMDAQQITWMDGGLVYVVDRSTLVMRALMGGIGGISVGTWNCRLVTPRL